MHYSEISQNIVLINCERLKKQGGNKQTAEIVVCLNDHRMK